MINNVKKIEIKEGDTTLKFEIHKMSAVAGERWILRAISLIGQGFNGGIAANLSSGNVDIGSIVRALCAAPFDDAMGLLNELLQYVYRVVDSKSTQQLDIDTISGFITSPLTLIKLRMEVAKYNFGFFQDLGELITPAGKNTD